MTAGPSIYYGGDYNPEQWPRETWQEDMRLMQAAGVNLVSLGIFSWAELQPRPGEYHFEWLDEVMGLLHAAGIQVALGTATASPPPWFSQAHPGSLPVAADGRPYAPGSRQHYCPNNAAFHQAATEMARAMAARYGQHPAVAFWHINNEMGCHIHACYCNTCRDEFRRWLQAQYGSLEALNAAWGTTFWSQRISAWEEIDLPNRTVTFPNPSQALDYRRFMNASLLKLYRAELAAVRAAGARQPAFTNGVFGQKALDLFAWGSYQDVVGLDLYIDPATQARSWGEYAFVHDLARGWVGGAPYLLVEQATTQVNWRATNPLKRPGIMRLFSYQALAHGSDSVMFFQWRASPQGAEKFHSGMLPHFGAEGSRVFSEVKDLGAELQQLAPVAGSRVSAPVALLVSYPNIWALELDSKPAQLEAWSLILPWYQALLREHFAVDVVSPEADLSPYRLVVAPALYQLSQEQAGKLRSYVSGGGTLVMTYFSGVVDEHERVGLGGYPALLQDVLGLRVEEWQPFLPGETNEIQISGIDSPVPCEHWADLLHLTTAEAVGVFGKDFYAGRPAITRNHFGAGEAYYFATRPEASALAGFYDGLLGGKGVRPLAAGSDQVEVGLRVKDRQEFLFLLNHQASPAHVHLLGRSGTDLLTGRAVRGEFVLEGHGVRVIQVAS